MDSARPPRNGNAQSRTNASHEGQIPKADPRTRRERMLRALPRYSGPYSVGIVDIEVPVEQPRVFSHITRKKRHLLQLETVLFSIYYPAALGSSTGGPSSDRGLWSRRPWLPKPRGEVAKGYGQFAGTPAWVSIVWFFTSTWFTKLPAFRNAKLATHYPQSSSSPQGEATGKMYEENSCPTFPLVIFSHGLGGTRTSSSTLCGDFASYGFIVVAMEHRDGSCARTFVHHPSEGPGSRENTVGVIDHSEEDLKRPYDRIDYAFPKHNPYDTSPNNEVGVDLELRRAQIELRKAEIKEALRVLQVIRDGDGHLIGAQNLRNETSKDGKVCSSEAVDWTSWKGRFHTTHVTMCGHSFGAATTIEVLRDRALLPNFSQGIALDMWAAAVPSGKGGETIRVPLLAISSEAFMWWSDNLQAAKAIAEGSRAAGNLAWLLTVRGSIHLSQTDIPILYPRICSALLKASIEPKRAVELNINLALEFLDLVMLGRGRGGRLLPLAAAAQKAGQEGLLRRPITEEMPEEHRPDNKWIGMRLKIPHEFATRIRNRKERGKTRRFERFEEEVWMHVAPADAEIEAHRRRAEGTED